jgi:hypothetical protein
MALWQNLMIAMRKRIESIPGVKLVGFLMLVTGWGLMLDAVATLKSQTQLTIFLLAGVGVELLGLIMAAVAHGAKQEAKD